jgi:branched-chain amino acid transport system substrate-binding protein
MKYLLTSLSSFLLFIVLLYPLHAEDSPLRVGVILPLSGFAAEYGVAARNGLELGLKEHPDVAKRLEVTYEDSKYDNRLTVTELQKFASSQKIDLTYIWGANPNEAAVPVAEQKKIPTLAVTTSRFLTKGKEWSTRFGSPSTTDAEGILTWLRQSNLKKICLVKTELTFINGIVDAMKDALLPDENLDVIDSYDIGDQDFKSSVLKITSRQCDTLGVFLATGQITQFYKEIKKAGYTGKTFGTDFFDSLTEVKNAAGTMEGAVFSSPRVSPSFRTRYISAYNNDAQIGFASNAYDFVLLLKEILTLSKNTFPRNAELVNAIRSVNKYSTENGDVSYSNEPSPGFTFPRSLKSINHDKIIEVN